MLHVAVLSGASCLYCAHRCACLCSNRRVLTGYSQGTTHRVLTRHCAPRRARDTPSGACSTVLHGTNHRGLTGTHRVLLTGYSRVLTWYYSQGTHRVLPGYSRRPSWAMRRTVRRRSRPCSSIGALPCGPMHCSIYSCSQLLLQCLRHTDAAQPEPALVRLVQELDNAQRPM